MRMEVRFSMLYCNPINTWLTECCLICGSVNHVFVYTDDAHAWECYFCNNRYWIDELAEDTYIITNDITEEEAHKDLGCTKSNVKCLYGHYEREQ